ncbi:hypothetical protein [Demequina sp. SO4-18]|uniref:hypothetical protein n=1 Tax=Demequina sp. SO4-18 TaxID=3401026 RepID=UPI003B5AADC4
MSVYTDIRPPDLIEGGVDPDFYFDERSVFGEVRGDELSIPVPPAAPASFMVIIYSEERAAVRYWGDDFDGQQRFVIEGEDCLSTPGE